MGAYRHRGSWRSVTFNEHFTDDATPRDDPASLIEAKVADCITLDEFDANRVSVQDFRELRQFLEGAEPNEAFEGVRALTGVGVINALSYGALEDKRWQLAEAFSVAGSRIEAAAADPKGVLPFRFKRDTASGPIALRYYARPGPGRPISVGRRKAGLSRPYNFQLIAFDPFAYDEAETQTTLGNLAGGNNTVTNPGNIYTKPRIRITFSGAGANPLTLTNSPTGQVMTFNLSTAAASEVWIIDVATSRMYRLSDGANRYSARLSGFISQMFLQQGANTILWSSATGITSVRFDFRGAYA